MKSTDKATELEKQVSAFRAKHVTLHSRITAKGVRIEQLVGMRQPVRNLTLSVNNAELCSMLYSDDSFRKQLAGVKAKFKELSGDLETVIANRFRQKAEMATTTNKLKDLTKQLPLPVECADGFTACLAEDGKAVPVYFLRYKNLKDTSGFVHNEYAIWFKGGYEFSTGFVGWPTGHGWNKVKNTRELIAALTEAIRDDGLIV